MRTIFILTLAVSIACAAPAFAAGNTITVKNADGTVTSIDIGPQPELPPADAYKKAGAPAQQTAPKKAEPKKAAVAKPEKKPVVKKEAAAKKKKTAPKKTAKKSTKQKAPQKHTAKQAAPKVPVAEPVQAPSRPQRLGPAMTSDDAIRIALDSAPPSRSVHAYPVNYKGLHAYQVVFKTEEGERSLFVDRESGKLVK